jgi:hypothetical protein
MTDEPTEAEIAAIRDAMMQPLSRERQIATEMQLYLHVFDKDIALWTDDDWLAFARHMIPVVEHTHDISAEEMKAALNAPWTGPPLPTFDEL